MVKLRFLALLWHDSVNLLGVNAKQTYRKKEKSVQEMIAIARLNSAAPVWLFFHLACASVLLKTLEERTIHTYTQIMKIYRAAVFHVALSSETYIEYCQGSFPLGRVFLSFPLEVPFICCWSPTGLNVRSYLQ